MKKFEVPKRKVLNPSKKLLYSMKVIDITDVQLGYINCQMIEEGATIILKVKTRHR